VFIDGGSDAQTIRLEGNIRSRTVGGSGIIVCNAGPECTGACIEEPFFGQFSSVKAFFPTLGAAVLACELAGLPWSAINLSRLKLHATGKGNARKPEMQAAAKARWGVDLKG
jgi:Holliday junction resolvasome RuvABC endonuclease subunit